MYSLMPLKLVVFLSLGASVLQFFSILSNTVLVINVSEFIPPEPLGMTFDKNGGYPLKSPLVKNRSVYEEKSVCA